MIAVYSPEEIRRIEFICCQLQQVSMIDLMERAGQAFTDWFHHKFANHKHAVHIFVAMAITVATDSLLDACFISSVIRSGFTSPKSQPIQPLNTTPTSPESGTCIL
ncbi:MAG: hypothetical protein U0T81_15290 [Saprospiraceae bacterium]